MTEPGTSRNESPRITSSLTRRVVASICIVVSLTAVGCSGGSEPAAGITGTWRAWLDCPGGELPFGIEIRDVHSAGHLAELLNGEESIPVPSCTFEEGKLVLDIDHYDSKIEATLAGDRIEGRWKKRRGVDRWSDMAFHAMRGAKPRFSDMGDAAPKPDSFAGRWLVDFSSSDDPAVAIFESTDDDLMSGTFMTTTGDYRFLAGATRGDELRLSCYDGAHAFLFHAKANEDGTLTGDFWSSDSWHETWTATRKDDAALPDAFEETTWTGPANLGEISFPDLEGNPRSLDDPEFGGKARILQVFGSWCPNCHDASESFAKLYGEYKDRGLSVLGLAFEHTGDHERDARQVRRYAERHGVTYPILIAGLSDKAKATESLGLLDRVRSYPTTIFLRADGTVRAIHTGFTGPATGAAYDELRAEFRSIIEELLAEGESGR